MLLASVLSIVLTSQHPQLPPEHSTDWTLTYGAPDGRAAVGHFVSHSGRGFVVEAEDNLALLLAPAIHESMAWMALPSSKLHPSAFATLPAGPGTLLDSLLVSNPQGLTVLTYDESAISTTSVPTGQEENVPPPFVSAPVVVAGIDPLLYANALAVNARDIDGDGVAEVALVDAQHNVRLLRRIPGGWTQTAIMAATHSSSSVQERWDVDFVRWRLFPEQTMQLVVSGTWGTQIFDDQGSLLWSLRAPPELPHAMAVMPPERPVCSEPTSEVESLAIVQSNISGSSQVLKVYWEGGNSAPVNLATVQVVGLSAGFEDADAEPDLALEYSNDPHPGYVRVLHRSQGVFSATHSVYYVMRQATSGDVYGFAFEDLNLDGGTDVLGYSAAEGSFVWTAGTRPAFCISYGTARFLEAEPLEATGFHVWAAAQQHGLEYGPNLWPSTRAGMEIAFPNIWGSTLTNQTHFEMTLWGAEEGTANGVPHIPLLRVLYAIPSEHAQAFRNGDPDHEMRIGFALPNTTAHPDWLTNTSDPANLGFNADNARYYVELRAVRYVGGQVSNPLMSYVAGVTYYQPPANSQDFIGSSFMEMLNDGYLTGPTMWRHDEDHGDSVDFPAIQVTKDDPGGLVPLPRVPPKKPGNLYPLMPVYKESTGKWVPVPVH